MWFDNVDIRVRQGPGKGYITANERASSNDPSYFVINNSTVDAVKGNTVKPGSYFLGKCEGTMTRADRMLMIPQAAPGPHTRVSSFRTRI